MRSIICVAVVAALFGLAGCANQEAAPSGQSPTQEDAPAKSQSIASEDFESGDAEEIVGSDVEPDQEAGDDSNP